VLANIQESQVKCWDAAVVPALIFRDLSVPCVCSDVEHDMFLLFCALG
jgi:hypothetical protein